MARDGAAAARARARRPGAEGGSLLSRRAWLLLSGTAGPDGTLTYTSHAAT